MKILFVSSGNRIGINPIIQNQADSLVKKGMEIDFYTIKGKGIRGYLKNIFLLRNQIRANKYDLIHAHYSFSALTTTLSGAKPLVVSLMGSDVKAGKLYKLIIRFFSFVFSWSAIIVKSRDMHNDLHVKDAIIIPNGVDMVRFNTMNRVDCQKQLGWDSDKLHLLFPSNPIRKEKNYDLAVAALKKLSLDDVEIHSLVNIPNTETVLWYNAANVVFMTSLWEGSPNAIKEAMACNRPIVTTDVGDVRWVIGNTEGCYITSYDVDDCANQIKKTIQFSIEKKCTNGRDRIVEIGLDSKSVAQKIKAIYDSVLANVVSEKNF